MQSSSVHRQILNLPPNGGFYRLAIPLFIFANLIIGLLMIQTLIPLRQGRLLLREPHPSLRYDKELL